MSVRNGVLLCLSLLLVCGLLWQTRLERQHETAFCPSRFAEQVLVIDAGHGGEDGGAVSAGGALESHINLAIARRVDAILGLFGAPVNMLRQEDISLHSESANTLRQKKNSDLHNRVAKVEEQDNAVLLSIHQNSYPDARYYGAQVFYAPTQGSEQLAVAMQEVLRLTLDESNHRQAKRIPDTIFLMNHISCPAILVECGFLSNPKEEQWLQDSGYQTKVATALAGGFLQLQQTLT